jgi:hypothetical protein
VGNRGRVAFFHLIREEVMCGLVGGSLVQESMKKLTATFQVSNMRRVVVVVPEPHSRSAVVFV